MSEISDSAAQYFCCENNPTGVSMRQDSGILQLFPGATVDDKAFEPCGYSMNAIVKVRGSSCIQIKEHYQSLLCHYRLWVGCALGFV